MPGGRVGHASSSRRGSSSRLVLGRQTELGGLPLVTDFRKHAPSVPRASRAPEPHETPPEPFRNVDGTYFAVSERTAAHVSAANSHAAKRTPFAAPGSVIRRIRTASKTPATRSLLQQRKPVAPSCRATRRARATHKRQACGLPNGPVHRMCYLATIVSGKCYQKDKDGNKTTTEITTATTETGCGTVPSYTLTGGTAQTAGVWTIQRSGS